ncbi:MAG TPA: DUF58 domain-containing protein [Thermoleophilia bacterium]|nr:DUF58 domain-containing protein [Thermoleophilia bacterium]
MTRPTTRGAGLLVVALATYLAARILGTWELYLLSFAFVAALLVSLALVVLAGRRLTAVRSLSPERPVAGEPLQVSLRVRNGSLVPGLQVTLPHAAGDLDDADRPVDFASLGPRAERVATAGPWPARRGVHRLPALVAEAEDPLGLVRTRREVGGALEVTVYPRLALLRSCGLFAGSGGLREPGRGGLVALGGLEFRGIRPHNPGEPLSHVDWKATAKTGNLMLRETEDPASGDVAVLLEGAASCVVGELPETNFELAVQVAGSLAAYTLRAGRGVTLLMHERDWGQTRFSADADGRQRLLESLARAEPHGPLRLGPSLRVLLASGSSSLRRQVARTQALTLVLLSVDRELVRAVVSLREEGRLVSVVYIAPDSFTSAPPATDAQGLLLWLASAGVPCLTVRRGDDLGVVLSLPSAEAHHARPV